MCRAEPVSLVNAVVARGGKGLPVSNQRVAEGVYGGGSVAQPGGRLSASVVQYGAARAKCGWNGRRRTRVGW